LCSSGRIAAAGWALWGLILMFVAIGVWWFGMRPLEHKMADLADAAVEGRAELGPEYARKSGTWLLLWGGTVGLILVVAYLMVFKPF